MRPPWLVPAGFLILFGPAVEGQGPPAEPVAARRGQELLELAGTCAKARLFNDEERLLLEAQALQPGDAAVRERVADLHRRRVAVANGEEAARYRAYLETDGYRKARADAAVRRAALDKRSMAAWLDAAERAPAAASSGAADGPLWSAFSLDPADARLRRLLGPERLAAFAARRREETGVGRLVLGKAIRGRDVEAKDLAGRVVLWRSFSL